MLNCKRSNNTQGFTLVELVTVILILGIIVVGVSSFIIFGTRIFVESSSVDQVLSQSRFAIERMTRELRSAVPNSVRLSSGWTNAQCIEFVPTETSTTYLAMPIAPEVGATSAVVIVDTLPSRIAAGQVMYIYPLTEADVYSAGSRKQALVSNVAVVSNQANLTFANAVQFAEGSPRQRVYFANQPVSYCFEGDPLLLKRYSGYALQTNQPTPSLMGGGVLMAQDLANRLIDTSDLPIALTPSTLVNNAMVHLQPRFNVNGATFQYRHQVQVINVP